MKRGNKDLPRQLLAAADRREDTLLRSVTEMIRNWNNDKIIFLNLDLDQQKQRTLKPL